MGAMSLWHWLIVLLIAVILFGSKRLPDAARGLGRSLRIFKTEIKEMQHEGDQKQGEQAKQEPPQLTSAPEQRAQSVDAHTADPQTAEPRPGTPQAGQQS
ncbi:Sec-independent protein translocase subunit TatA [Hoyosella subflava]|uniref:Sec-independent protein translocase protein TatA n=1 Tax=Hoyosella subflava (strain DSM 45089 / JCM 17490 / NBRC 109087 / DQS3-9A1) TaxID=443218 RepID=F6ENZ8_HOYSD|nr:Sec-independent protein translocase subunit TatA [Hoyosella subflava]AEF40464.1 Sec-independent protein translocase TatA/E-like protein [Hoyosella subflava DQS3-9A1]